MFLRKRILILTPILLIGACTVGLILEAQGPRPAVAFRWIFGKPPPEYVTSLRSDFYSHLKGYTLHLGFSIPPSRLHEIVDTESSFPLYRAEHDYLERWQHEGKFKEMYPNEPPDVKKCRKITRTIKGQTWTTVYNPDVGQVYCYYCSDSDIEP